MFNRIFIEKEIDLSCNTEKDIKSRKLQHITGTAVHKTIIVYHILFVHCNIRILVGAWPCEIVTMVSELFCAESKTQVK